MRRVALMLSLVVAGYFILARDKQPPAHARSYDGVEGPKQWGDLCVAAKPGKAAKPADEIAKTGKPRSSSR